MPLSSEKIILKINQIIKSHGVTKKEKNMIHKQNMIEKLNIPYNDERYVERIKALRYLKWWIQDTETRMRMRARNEQK